MIWIYIIKNDRTRKARYVCNGSPVQKGTITLSNTYTASLEQVDSHIFLVLAALDNLKVYGIDAINTFAKASPLVVPLYITINKAYRNWFENYK